MPHLYIDRNGVTHDMVTVMIPVEQKAFIRARKLSFSGLLRDTIAEKMSEEAQ